MNKFGYFEVDGNATATWGRSHDRRYWDVFFHDTRFNPKSCTCVTNDFGDLVWIYRK